MMKVMALFLALVLKGSHVSTLLYRWANQAQIHWVDLLEKWLSEEDRESPVSKYWEEALWIFLSLGLPITLVRLVLLVVQSMGGFWMDFFAEFIFLSLFFHPFEVEKHLGQAADHLIHNRRQEAAEVLRPWTGLDCEELEEDALVLTALKIRITAWKEDGMAPLFLWILAGPSGLALALGFKHLSGFGSLRFEKKAGQGTLFTYFTEAFYWLPSKIGLVLLFVSSKQKVPLIKLFERKTDRSLWAYSHLLRVRLGGPERRGGQLYVKPWIGLAYKYPDLSAWDRSTVLFKRGWVMALSLTGFLAILIK